MIEQYLYHRMHDRTDRYAEHYHLWIWAIRILNRGILAGLSLELGY